MTNRGDSLYRGPTELLEGVPEECWPEGLKARIAERREREAQRARRCSYEAEASAVLER